MNQRNGFKLILLEYFHSSVCIKVRSKSYVYNKIFVVCKNVLCKLSKKILIKFREYFGFDVNFVTVCEDFLEKEDVKNLKLFLLENKIKYLSIFHKLIDKNFVNYLPTIELFAWTVNDKRDFVRLRDLGVKNFATDEYFGKFLSK